MPCFSLLWIEQLVIWAIIVVAVVAVIKLLIPYILRQLGEGGAVVMRVLNIVMWAVVLIFIVVVVFDLIACALGAGSLRLR